MARIFFSPHHVETLALLPKTLTPGVAYFVDDEHQIVIDFGDGKGARVYGGASWITANGAGNTGFLQDQVNTLSGGVLAFEKAYWDETQYIRRELAHKADITGEELRELRRLSGVNSEGLLNLTFAVNEEIGKSRDQTAGLILQSNANTAGILSLAQAVNEQAKKQSDGTAHLVHQANANTEGILRLSAVLNEETVKTEDHLTRLTLQANANTEGILRLSAVLNEETVKTEDHLTRLTLQANANTEALLRLAVSMNEMWAETKAALSTLQAAVSEISAKQDIVIPDFPSPPPLPPKRDRILAYYLMPEDIIRVDGYTWTVTEITRSEDGRITLTLDLIEGES